MPKRCLLVLMIAAVAVVWLGVWSSTNVNGCSFSESFDDLEQEDVDDSLTLVEGPVPYYDSFLRHAPELGWDWQLLAAVAWHESKFNPNAKSYAGAGGVMQLMPKTAKRFGLNDSTTFVAEDNIRAGVELIKYLQSKWYFISNKEEQTKFVLASYNAGPGFIFDARRQVREEGGNPNSWAQVEPYVQQAATRAYVHKVLHTAQKYRKEYGDVNLAETKQ